MHSLSDFWGIITGADKKKNYPEQQGEVMGRVGDFMSVQPYGIYANLPNGQRFHFIDTEGRFIFGATVVRPSGVDQGEVTVHHPDTGAVIHLKNNGDINIDNTGNVSGNININTKNVNVTASEDVNLTCVNASVTASAQATFTTPLTTCTGNLVVVGSITSASLAVSGAVTNAGKDIGKNHGHTQANDSAGDSQAAISGVT